MQKLKKPIALVVAALLLLASLSVFAPLCVAASEQEEQQQSGSRFIFSSLKAQQDGYLYTVDQSKPFVLDLFSHGTVFHAPEVTVPDTKGANNTLYVALINASNATNMLITYTYIDNNVHKLETVAARLTPSSAEKQSLTLEAPNISSSISDLKITFLADGAVAGSITLETLSCLSLYQNEEASGAVLSECYYDAAAEQIVIKGTVDSAITVSHTGLALFVLDPSDGSFLSNKTPIARMPISTEFYFTVPVEDAEDIFSRYVVAAVSERESLRKILFPPRYPAVSRAVVSTTHGFKGFHAEDVASVLEVGAGIEIVDVYLDRLHGDQTTGILYVGDRSYYYFNELYVAELDDRIRSLTGIGCAVYLRFLISPDATDLPYVVYAEDSDSIVYKSISVDSKEALYSVFALTDFLTDRYAGDEIGRLSGIILGQQVNRSSVYNYSNAENLAEYTEQYVSVLQLVAGAARLNIPGLDIVVPVGDRVFEQSFTTADLDGDYYAEFFLISVLRALLYRSISPIQFSLMLESQTLPSRVIEGDGGTYGTDRISEFDNMLKSLSAQYPCLSDQYIYSFMPASGLTTEQLLAAYAAQYITLYFDEAAKAFFVDLSLLDAQEASRITDDLSFLVKKIDTSEAQTVLTPMMALLGVSDFTAIHPDYLASAMQLRSEEKVALQNGQYASGANPIGSCVYWDFNTTTETLGWYAVSNCIGLSVISGDQGRALTATMSALDGEYAEIAYSFKPNRDLSFAPLMRFSLGVSGTPGTPYEVRICLVGASSDIVSATVLTSGEQNELCLDLSAYQNSLKALRCIRILVRPLDGDTDDYAVRLQRITLQSTELDDEELGRRLADLPDTDTGDQGETGRDFTAMIVTAVVIFASLALVAFIVLQNRAAGAKRRAKAHKTDKNNV